MIESSVVSFIINASLVILVLMIPVSFYRVWKGPKAADRLVGVDMITTLLVGIVILLSLTEGTNTTIDMGIVLAALAFAATLSIARYISEGRVF